MMSYPSRASGRLPSVDVHDRILRMLHRSGAWYRIIEHEPEGRTIRASELRGHPLRQAAKCIVVQVAQGKTRAIHALAVVPGDRRIDLQKVRGMLGGSRAFLAARVTAEQLTGCVSGAVVPFSFSEGLHLIVDPDVLAEEVLYFNAARLDRSLALRTSDYVALAGPRVEPISESL